jgi:short-subunit dehydrogenase
MAPRFDDRLVLITGASAGIGREAAALFIERGARVVALARSRESLDTLAAELGERVVPLVADVTDGPGMEAAAQRVLDGIGVPDVVVANAGIGLDARFEEMTDDALRTVFEVNVFGLVRTVRPYLRPMVDRGSGRILFISSIVGKRGTPHYSAYSASKFALHGMADALRSELCGSGVSVGLVCPSSTETEFQRRLLRRGPGQAARRPRKHSARSVAEAIVAMAASNRREIVLSAEAKLLVAADALAPKLVDRLLARILTKNDVP